MLLTKEKARLDKNRMGNATNSDFMKTIFSISEKYDLLTEADLDILVSDELCHDNFGYTHRAILVDITDLNNDQIDELIYDNYDNGRSIIRYYKNPVYNLKGRMCLASNDMYGKYKDGKPVRNDNRTPLYEWFIKRVKDRSENFEDTLKTDDYNVNFTKEEWMSFLKREAVFSDMSIAIIKEIYNNGGQLSFTDLAFNLGNDKNYYILHSIELAKKIIDAAGVKKSDNEDDLLSILYMRSTELHENENDNTWKLRDELYDAFKSFLAESAGDDMLEKDIIKIIKKYISSKGFFYEDGFIENFYLSLKSKPFVILAGTSGTGKTRLARLFAEAIGADTDNGRYKLVSVRPDWSDTSDLFGHADLNGSFQPGPITEFVENAINDGDNPYILCLDEMNLARVEYYLSDILSVMETRDYEDERIVTDPIILQRHDDLTIPDNLYIIGTVNMDETTFPFSRKVLDRANTIEFSYVDLIPKINDSGESEINPLKINNNFLKTKYLYLNECMHNYYDDVQTICEELKAINDILEPANAHIAYRIRDEIVFYILNNNEMDLIDIEDAFDYQILQKILPRIQGSSSFIRDMIIDLFKYCAGDYEGYRSDSGDISTKMIHYLKINNGSESVKYPRSAKKLAFMMRRFEEDGFTSYWL